MDTKQTVIISQIESIVRDRLSNDSSGHDWWHIHRVVKNARLIMQTESANTFVVELAALLHDIADWKLHNGDESVGLSLSLNILRSQGVEEHLMLQVVSIIEKMSFKGAGVDASMDTIEGKIVQDADRLDAIGAIGIGRTFAYGGFKGRLMYDPSILPTLHESSEAYKKNQSPTVNHFYEKLLLLKDLMNTESARQIAEGRHAFMESFLDRFFAEWNGQA